MHQCVFALESGVDAFSSNAECAVMDENDRDPVFGSVAFDATRIVGDSGEQKVVIADDISGDLQS